MDSQDVFIKALLRSLSDDINLLDAYMKEFDISEENMATQMGITLENFRSYREQNRRIYPHSGIKNII